MNVEWIMAIIAGLALVLQAVSELRELMAIRERERIAQGNREHSERKVLPERKVTGDSDAAPHRGGDDRVHD